MKVLSLSLIRYVLCLSYFFCFTDIIKHCNLNDQEKNAFKTFSSSYHRTSEDFSQSVTNINVKHMDEKELNTFHSRKTAAFLLGSWKCCLFVTSWSRREYYIK